MDSIITYLLIYNQYLITIIGELLLFISQHIPLKQMIFDDSNSPEYQKFKVDRLPTILKFEKVDYKLLLAYYKHKYNKTLKPVQRRNGKSIPKKTKCPKCGAPHEYIYDNNGNKGQFKCKVCQLTFKEGYQVSDTRATGPCILTMRMAFDKFKKFPGKALNFVADGYSAYPLAKQQFELEENKEFNLTQVIGLTNEDLVSEEFRWVKQVVERLNRTFKSSYRVTCGYGSDEGALYGFSLWVAYYNFLRPHPYNYHRPLNELDALNIADNMPAKWQILINLGQQTILNMQESKTS